APRNNHPSVSSQTHPLLCAHTPQAHTHHCSTHTHTTCTHTHTTSTHTPPQHTHTTHITHVHFLGGARRQPHTHTHSTPAHTHGSHHTRAFFGWRHRTHTHTHTHACRRGRSEMYPLHLSHPGLSFLQGRWEQWGAFMAPGDQRK